MINEAEFQDRVDALVVRGKSPAPATGIKPRGYFTIQHIRDGKILQEIPLVPNGVVNEGKDYILNAGFNDATSKIQDWAIGLIDNASFSALADTDTMASHPGWIEFTTYSEVTRPEWDPGAAASQQITNAVLRDFNITGSGTLYGVFISSDDTKGGTTGTLWATAAFAATIPVNASDLIRIAYTVTVS